MTDSVGRAPGRIDLMGGVADYSGALVLQASTAVHMTVRAVPAARLMIGNVELTTVQVAELAALDYATLRGALADLPKWTLYPLGVVLVLIRHGIIDPPMIELHVDSDVPPSVGLSSSAALEVATARALTAGKVDPIRLAFLCQEAENEVVGAPCGVMDQIAVSLGAQRSILPILCRPGTVEPALQLAPDLEVIGWPTGAEHDVSGLPYRRARTAAFMGKRIIEDLTGRRSTWVSEIPEDLLDLLPEIMEGRTFLDRWGATADHVTTVEEAIEYPVRAATGFGAAEHLRSQAVVAALRTSNRISLRDHFAASHRAYGSMGLGHPAADSVVREALDRRKVYGARSSGGGSGGTVAVLCARGALDDVQGVIR